MIDAMRSAREHVAEEVRAQLARRRISVSEAARRLGMGQPSLYHRITGHRPFDAEELAALAEILDVPVADFYKGIPKMGFRTTRFRPLLALI